MRVKATAVEVKTASPSGALRDGPRVGWKRVRRIGWGFMPGEEGFRPGPVKERKRSKQFLSLRKSRSVFKLLRLS